MIRASFQEAGDFSGRRSGVYFGKTIWKQKAHVNHKSQLTRERMNEYRGSRMSCSLVDSRFSFQRPVLGNEVRRYVSFFACRVAPSNPPVALRVVYDDEQLALPEGKIFAVSTVVVVQSDA
jgi:hypothetical protein